MRGMDLREKIGYLVYAFDSANADDRTRAQYLELADDILTVVRADDLVKQARPEHLDVS